MQGLKFVKKLAVPCGFVAMAVPVAKSQHDSSAPCCHDSTNKKLIRPSELPIYSAEHACSTNTTDKADNGPPSLLEQNIREIRRAVQKVVREYQGITDSISNTIDTGIAHSQSTIDYLQEESNIAPRMGAIGIGGLTGLIMGLRGGAFKRLLYTTTGALSVSMICYPKAAEESFQMAEHYIKVGYNFVYGVKPGDKQLELPSLELPKLPSSFSELSELVIDTGLKVGNTIVALPYQAIKAVTEKEANSGVDSKPK